MATAAVGLGSVVVPAHESHHVRASRERNAKRRTAEETFVFPPDAVCFRVVNRAMELRQHGFRDGEIDDQVGREMGLQGWQVQYIILYFAEMKVRELQAAQALAKNLIDEIQQAGKATFAESPGRRW